MSYIDTRDLYKRQCELQSELDALKEAEEDAQEVLDNLPMVEGDNDTGQGAIDDAVEVWTASRWDISDWENEHLEELKALDLLESEVGSEWSTGETLIPENDFEQYAQDFAEDIGAISRHLDWPCDYIDWERAADGLRMDYSEVEYEGTTYLFRE